MLDIAPVIVTPQVLLADYRGGFKGLIIPIRCFVDSSYNSASFLFDAVLLIHFYNNKMSG